MDFFYKKTVVSAKDTHTFSLKEYSSSINIYLDQK